MRISLSLIGTSLPLFMMASSVWAVDPLPPEGEGRRAFLKYNCYGCHGQNAAGGMGPDIRRKDRDDVKDAVEDGMDGGMRSFQGIVTETEVSNIAAYLRSIGTPKEPKFYDWWVPVPTK